MESKDKQEAELDDWSLQTNVLQGALRPHEGSDRGSRPIGKNLRNDHIRDEKQCSMGRKSSPDPNQDNDYGTDLESDADDDEDYDAPYLAQRRTSVSPRIGKDWGDAFMDEVDAGINSYLDYLQNSEKGVVYNKRLPVERDRWRKHQAQLVERAIAAAAEGAQNTSNRSEEFRARWASGQPPGGCPGLAYDFEGGSPRRSVTSELGPCAPPNDLVFEEADVVDNFGRQRLLFSSSFECGNLAYAQAESPTNYTLFLDFDVNTLGYTQWFYFAVRGGIAGQKVCFKIANMSKAHSLFEEGRMRPVVWSERNGRGWERGCSDISYYANTTRRNRAAQGAGEGGTYYRTLEFHYSFEYENDTVFFSYHYPYTYTYLQDFLSAMCLHPYAGKFLRRGTLCKTINGIPCEMLEINGSESHDVDRTLAVVTARVHPGEANASWMVQGFVQFLCSPAPEAQALRSACSWLIVPMLNPDGVIQGNYRCGLAGADLNRFFDNPHHQLHPEIWALKQRLRGKNVDFYLDFHGHSREEGIFFYGGKFDGGSTDERNAHIRLLPKLCGLASSDFKYSNCSFNLSESKMTTARLVAFLRLGVLQAYTVEASFASAGDDTPEFVGMENAELDEGEAGGSKVASLKRLGDVCIEPDSAPHRADVNVPFKSRDQQSNDFTKDQDVDAAAWNAKVACRDPAFAVWAHEFEKLPISRRASRRTSTLRRVDSGQDIRGSTLDRSDSSDDGATPLTAGPSIVTLGHPQLTQGLSTLDVVTAAAAKISVVAAADALAASATKKAQLSRDFVPARLELAGPTVARALAMCWSCQKGLMVKRDTKFAGTDLLDGYEAKAWDHLRYDRLNPRTAQAELARLRDPRLQLDSSKGGDHSGSDSNPDEDEKRGEDLKKVHRMMLHKMRMMKQRRRKKARVHDDTDDKKDKGRLKEDDDTVFKTVIAFGQKVKVQVSSRPSVIKSGGDIVAKPGGDIVTKSGVDIVCKSGVDIVCKSGGDIVSKSGGDIVSKSGGDIRSKSEGDIDLVPNGAATKNEEIKIPDPEVATCSEKEGDDNNLIAQLQLDEDETEDITTPRACSEPHSNPKQQLTGPIVSTATDETQEQQNWVEHLRLLPAADPLAKQPSTASRLVSRIGRQPLRGRKSSGLSYPLKGSSGSLGQASLAPPLTLEPEEASAPFITGQLEQASAPFITGQLASIVLQLMMSGDAETPQEVQQPNAVERDRYRGRFAEVVERMDQRQARSLAARETTLVERKALLVDSLTPMVAPGEGDDAPAEAFSWLSEDSALVAQQSSSSVLPKVARVRNFLQAPQQARAFPMQEAISQSNRVMGVQAKTQLDKLQEKNELEAEAPAIVASGPVAAAGKILGGVTTPVTPKAATLAIAPRPLMFRPPVDHRPGNAAGLKPHALGRPRSAFAAAGTSRVSGSAGGGSNLARRSQTQATSPDSVSAVTPRSGGGESCCASARSGTVRVVFSKAPPNRASAQLQGGGCSRVRASTPTPRVWPNGGS